MLHDLWILLAEPRIITFLVMLGMLTTFHHHKLLVVGGALPVMAILFVIGHEWNVWALAHHFSEKEEYHLLYNLAILLPGFSIIAYYFEHSGFDARISKYIDSDGKLLWTVFVLSIGLDNIAAAMIGGVLVRARYGQSNAPFVLLVGVVCAANLGGAGSFIGDTTTVMLYITGVSILVLAKAFVATIPAQFTLGLLKHKLLPLPTKKGRPTPVKWKYFAPLLGIPGLVLGNILFDEPGFGLWAGLALGCLLGRVPFRWLEIVPNSTAMKATYFLVGLVAAASLIPTEAFRPLLADLSTTQVSYSLGVLSAFFDNIPLTKLGINLGGFDWGELAYAVGFGGSSLWFGSSAGVALGSKFPELYDTKKWLKGPFWIVQGIYALGFAAYVGFWGYIHPAANDLLQPIVSQIGIIAVGILIVLLAMGVHWAIAKTGIIWFPSSTWFKKMMKEVREEWY